jgi:hypothetical protein
MKRIRFGLQPGLDSLQRSPWETARYRHAQVRRRTAPVLAITVGCGMVLQVGCQDLGDVMKRLVLAAALAAAALQLPAAAMAKGACFSPAAMEADQAIRYITDLMVVSSACQNPVYGEFRARNQAAIRDYQHTLIVHFHGTKGFDNWNTVIANELSMQHNNTPTAVMCQQSTAMFARASSQDLAGFRAFAAGLATAASAQYEKCRR